MTMPFDPAALLHPLMARILSDSGTHGSGIDSFLSEYRTPLIEPGAATFLWHGQAEQVTLLRWIHAGVDRTPLTLLPGGSLWYARIDVEDGGRFEYKLGITRHGHEEWIVDPHNPHRAGDPFGENSVCRTFGYERPAWSRQQNAPQGRMEAVTVPSSSFGETRQERIYLPAGYSADETYPLVIFHDGEDFVTYADLQPSLDNLIAAGDIPPVVAVLVQTANRLDEYPRGRRHARYLVHELLPAVTAQYGISGEPEKRILLGASLGAVASLATALRYPGIFGGLVLQSGSFVMDQRKLANRPHPVFQRVSRLIGALKRAPDLPPTRAFVSTGMLEGLADDNREMASLLRNRGVDVLFKSAWDGHHWHNWRDQLRDGLIWVLGSGNRNQ